MRNRHNLPAVEFGRKHIRVSRVILGCASIGGMGSATETWGRYGLDDEQASAYLDRGLDFGFTMLDTSCSYAGGHSERVIGRWLSQHPGAMLVATKVGMAFEPDLHVDLSPQHILDEVQLSLERLDVKSLDLYLTHGPSLDTPISETLETLASLVEDGRVKSLGACNLTAEQLREALDASERLGLPRFEVVQNEYNLLRPDDERDVIPLCRESGLAYTAHSPLSGGVLSGKYRWGVLPPPGSRIEARPAPYASRMTAEVLAGVERLTLEATRIGVHTASLALAWILSDQGVTAAIVAPRDADQLSEVREALDLKLSPAERDRLSEMVPATPD
jgi:aryl-alcohol dehydrogenase-like predicted oxidoreductase